MSAITTEPNAPDMNAAAPSGTVILAAGDPDAVVQRGIYRHFKGAIYQVLMVATSEATGRRDVIYSRVHGDSQVWSRPVSDFTDTVATSSGPVPRFDFVAAR